MTVFRVQKSNDFSVISNEHLRRRDLSLKAKGLLTQMLSLPPEWDYSLQGLAAINRDGIDSVRSAVKELEAAGYVERKRARDSWGRVAGCDYLVHERSIYPLPEESPEVEADQNGDSCEPALEKPTLENPMQEKPTLENPTQGKPTQENPTQLNTKELITNRPNDGPSKTEESRTKESKTLPVNPFLSNGNGRPSLFGRGGRT